MYFFCKKSLDRIYRFKFKQLKSQELPYKLVYKQYKTLHNKFQSLFEGCLNFLELEFLLERFEVKPYRIKYNLVYTTQSSVPT